MTLGSLSSESVTHLHPLYRTRSIQFSCLMTGVLEALPLTIPHVSINNHHLPNQEVLKVGHTLTTTAINIYHRLVLISGRMCSEAIKISAASRISTLQALVDPMNLQTLTKCTRSISMNT